MLMHYIHTVFFVVLNKDLLIMLVSKKGTKVEGLGTVAGKVVSGTEEFELEDYLLQRESALRSKVLLPR